MKLFQCQCCGQILYFENTVCLRCGNVLGYLPDEDRMLAVQAEGPVWRALPDLQVGRRESPDPGPLRFCRNWERSACNWMQASDGVGQAGFCLACQHNRTVPDLSTPEHVALWTKMEAAKRRLMYSVLRLNLPRPLPGSGHSEPLVFDFLADDKVNPDPVLTGHSDGIITIALIEADDAAREQRRSQMGEAYRTLLGHFRHEVGHYYWDMLVRDGDALDACRDLFGDERADYADAMQQHYKMGAPEGWETRFVSAYATMHPWEDWAETWAHYLHMIDTLETAGAMGLQMDAGTDFEVHHPVDPYQSTDAAQLIGTWVPLTLALNSLNRSMGQSDLYPFSLPAAVQAKLGFVHDLVSRCRVEPKSPSSV
ncbi:putative zinc-binding metallopeptidase [Pseudotabrizicola sp.]|uniref:zinc-binding metallopeptidase family protein n=1 Tax=Pseudotabrizicola sp. TaxID=2939647 RepID=UPI0027160B67|nr:putative zinc-binding metallopeptidase [Pseudotabrizicola sp.]MDO8882039.1 putative zinc-binding metallopeptidase [Pseudotabrizicola sp.]